MGNRVQPDFGRNAPDPDDGPRHAGARRFDPTEPQNSEALGETKVDLEAQTDEAAPKADADVDLDEVYDRPERTEDASLRRYDPEAGKMGLTVKLRAVRERIDTPFGRLVTAFPIALGAVTLGIFAIAFPTWPMLAGTGIAIPGAGWYLWHRYQQWLGHKRYMYRLLETLGEDVSDWNMDQVYRKPKVRRARR